MIQSTETLFDAFAKETGDGVTLTMAEVERCHAICGRIRGWSDAKQYGFFKMLLQLPVKRVLVLGVYHGRDIAFILDLLAVHYPGRDIKIVGVDRFTADPCADWAATNKVRTWEEEAKAPPPSFETAVENTKDPRVEIIRSDDFTFMDSTDKKFDAVYFDTSHDFNTLVRQLRQAPRICAEGAILCGDDFSNQYTWGVKAAVEQKFQLHLVFAEWIWVSGLELLKP